MIQATKEHHLTLNTTDERTAGLANMIHNMGAWLREGLINKETYVHIHNILREEIGTENFLSVVGYRDEREESNEYSIRVIEFPEKSDGTIRSCVMKDDAFYLVTELKEAIAVIDAFGFENNNKTEEKGEF